MKLKEGMKMEQEKKSDKKKNVLSWNSISSENMLKKKGEIDICRQMETKVITSRFTLRNAASPSDSRNIMCGNLDPWLWFPTMEVFSHKF
jgi:hypothetical protein